MYKNIILIDDSSIDTFIHSTFINRYKICETIDIFNSAKAALTFFKNEENNIVKSSGIIFLDLDMPEMNGFDFLKAFSKFPISTTSEFKIIMLSASMNPVDMQEANENPLIFKFTSKPLTANFLLSI